MFDQDNVPDKFEYSRYLFAGYCMNTIGRRYMFITPEGVSGLIALKMFS